MHVAARARLVLARRPWIHWTAVGLLAAVAAITVHAQLDALARTRDDWGTTRPVLVARDAAGPGEGVSARTVQLPVAMLPDGALEEWPPGATLQRRVGAGEVLTDLDVSVGAGPAARAERGTVVVGVPVGSADAAVVGAPVQVAADGLVLADRGTVVDVTDGVVFVAVDRSDGATVAAAAHQGTASLLYLP
jgi:hypothetical protein